MKTLACFASTLDGKIGSAHNLKDRVGSKADLTHLLTVRNQADALLCGGETFRQTPGIRQGNQQSVAPLHCILTKDVNLPPDAPLFVQSTQTTPFVPIVIATPEPVVADIQTRYPAHVEWFVTGGGNPAMAVKAFLAEKGIQTMMVEGGGHIFNLFLEAQAVDELYLTVCPLLLGGKEDPTLVTGPGFRVAEAPRTTVISKEWRGEELYLHLQLNYPPVSQLSAS